MDDRMGAERAAQPGIEREIAVRRHQIGVVMVDGDVDVVAARRLHADDGIAEAQRRDRESAAIERARTEGRIAFGRTPALQHLLRMAFGRLPKKAE